jgi:endonuclease/exonuclease/phosphatase family metal-dependent hydrolase
MVRRQASGDWLAPAAAMTTLLLVEILRVWLPSVTFVYGRAGSTPATTMGMFAAVWFLVPLVAVPLLRRAPTGLVFGVTGLATAALRLVLQATSGGDAQLWVASFGVLAGLLALTALAAGAASGHVARTGVLAGLLLQGVLHIALGTHQLVWRQGWVSITLVVLLATLAGLLVLRAASAPGWAPETGPGIRGAAWPWLLVGPSVALVTIVSAAPARLELATGLGPGAGGALLTAAHLAGVAVAVLGPAWRPARVGLLGAALLLAGVVGALQPSGMVAGVAQLLLPLGLGGVVGATAGTRGGSTVARRALALAGSWLLFLVIGFVYYAAYDIALGFPNRVLLIVAATIVGALGVTAAARPASMPAPQAVGTALRGVAVAVATGAVIAGVGAAHNLAPTSLAAGADDDGVTVVLANLQMGYDVSGRHAFADQARTLADLAPDALVLNEVDRGWLLTGGHDNLRLTSRDLGLPHEVFAPAADEVWGNALLTRLPLVQEHTSRLPREGAPMRRSLVSVVVELGGDRELGVIGTHLHHVEDEPEIRLRQVRVVAGEVARLLERDLPVVLLGDLNAEQGAPELEPLEALLEHAVPTGTPTWPAWDPQVQIDHVMVSDGLEVRDTTVTTSEVSDHLFVSVEVAPR